MLMWQENRFVPYPMPDEEVHEFLNRCHKMGSTQPEVTIRGWDFAFRKDLGVGWAEHRRRGERLLKAAVKRSKQAERVNDASA